MPVRGKQAGVREAKPSATKPAAPKRVAAVARPRRVPASRARDYLWRKISDDLRRKLRTGAIAPGARLPSVNELAAAWGANRLTVMKAINDLKDAGLVMSVRAQGNFAAKRGAVAEVASEERALTIGLFSRVLNPHGYGVYHQEMIAGLWDELGEKRATLLVLPAGEEAPSAMPELIRRARADAMIYMGAFEPNLLAELLRVGPPAVVLDHDAGDLPVDGVRVDNPAIGRLAARHLLSLGLAPETLAVLEGNPDDLSSRRRLAGFSEEIRAAGGDPARIRRATGWYMRNGASNAIGELLAGGNAPRGLYCMNDEMASGAVEGLRAAGLRVPGDIRVVGTDDTLWAQASSPPLTTVAIDVRRMGAVAVRLLMKRLAFPDEPFAREILEPSLVVRES